jgi:hypothetical protein
MDSSTITHLYNVGQPEKFIRYPVSSSTQESQSDLQIRSFSIGSASDFIGMRHFS